jgi:hypothetical protein
MGSELLIGFIGILLTLNYKALYNTIANLRT